MTYKIIYMFFLISLAYVIALISSSNIYLHNDEVNYIYDAFMMARGELPSFMHAPSGLFTFMNMVILYLNIFSQYFLFSAASIDHIYYDALSDFTNIKLLYVFVVIFWFGLLIIKSPQIALPVLFWLSISSDLRAIFLSGMPYSLAITLSLYAIKFNHELKIGVRDPNSLIDILLFGLAVGCRLEFIVIAPLFFNYTGLSKHVMYRRLSTLFLAICVFAPWVILYPIGPAKILLGYILSHNIMILIVLVLFVFTALIFKYASHSLILHFLSAFFLVVIALSFFDDRVNIRWALGPSLIVTVVYVQKYKPNPYWLFEKKAILLISVAALTTLWCHAYFYQTKNAQVDHRVVNLVEKHRIGEEMNLYITCATTSKNRLRKLERLGLSGFFLGGLFKNANLEEKQLSRFIELRKLQRVLKIDSNAPRKKLILAGGNYKGC